MYKKIILLFVVGFFGTATYLHSQEFISADLFFDPKLALTKDQHNNTGNTANFLTNISLQLEQDRFGYAFIGQSLEYADLSGGAYFRYAYLQFGYTIDYFPFAQKFEASAAVNLGTTYRWGKGYNNYGGYFDLAYKFNERLKLVGLLQFVRRTEIESEVNPEPIIRTSFFVGLRYDVLSLCLK